eukprot:TRINITY_DN12976_c1_g2_i1.p1 TRINITY_DN12976_c1_g2~~TRINITY_DN12976_c1_g2_i1.p1  ORF type:complete len:287 (+),score=32.29 TRINITY_DN12976_c1_g2_i1:107-967(+)
MIAPGNHLLRQGMAAPAFQPQQLQHQQGLTTTMGHVSHAFTQPPSGNSSTALMFMPSNTQVAPALSQGPYSMQLALADSVASDNLKDPDNRSKAYMSMINALDSWGFFQNLPLDAAGTLHYSAPFCHDHFETILIVPFLVQRILDQGAARQMTMAGCDQNPQEPWWTAWREWTSRHFGHRGVSLDCFVRDLERLEPPKAGLIIAAHPETTNKGPWPTIIGNVLKSRVPGARLVFMNFYRQEAEATVEECRLHGAQAEIRENPYYAGTEKYAVGTSYRYAVLVQPIL